MSQRTLLCIIIFASPSFATGEDHVGGYGPTEKIIREGRFPKGVTEDKLKEMALSDPELRIAYARLPGSFANGPTLLIGNASPEMHAVLGDLTRRGDSATPLLLDMMEKNPNTSLEHLLLAVVDRIGIFNMEPYLDYWRNVVRTRTDEINTSAAEVVTKIFVRHGTKEDIELVRWLADEREFLRWSIMHKLEGPNRVRRPGDEDRPKGIPRLPEPMASVDQLDSKSTAPPVDTASPQTSTFPLLAWMGGIVAAVAVALTWLLFRRTDR